MELFLADQSIALVGTFELGTDFANDGTLFMSDDNFARLFPLSRTARRPAVHRRSGPGRLVVNPAQADQVPGSLQHDLGPTRGRAHA